MNQQAWGTCQQLEAFERQRDNFVLARDVLARLSEFDRQVMVRRYGLDGRGERTISRIAYELEVLPACVQQAHRRVCAKIRKEDT